MKWKRLILRVLYGEHPPKPMPRWILPPGWFGLARKAREAWHKRGHKPVEMY